MWTMRLAAIRKRMGAAGYEDEGDTVHVSYHTALQFRALPIPMGSEITSAKQSWHPTNEVDFSHAL